jgi:hypothetical protein
LVGNEDGLKYFLAILMTTIMALMSPSNLIPVQYHDKVANEPRIKAHYAKISEGSLRWTYQPGAFADLI